MAEEVLQPDAVGRPGRILVSRLRHLGDVILSTPLLEQLHRSFPEARIDYLADAQALEALRHHPAIHRLWPAPRGVAATLRCMRALRRERFDAAIDLYCNPRSALLVRASGAPIRIGEARRVRRHAYTVARRLRPGRNAVAQHLDAARVLGCRVPAAAPLPRLTLTSQELEQGEARWRACGLGGAGRVLMHPVASRREKGWPAAPAAATVDALAQRGCSVVLGTPPGSATAVEDVRSRCRSGPRRLDAMPLRAYLGVVAAADAVVAVDGAVVHAAVALRRPTVALFGPTDPAIWFPYAGHGPYEVLHGREACAACQGGPRSPHTCMAALGPEAVLAALERVRRTLGANGEAQAGEHR